VVVAARLCGADGSIWTASLFTAMLVCDLQSAEVTRMLFMVHYEIEPENRDNSYARVLALGGDGIPDGVKVLGTWSSITQLEGWVVVEATDSLLLGQYMRHWTNLNVNRMIPIVDADGQRAIMTGAV
jgi:hypothetical protein